MARRNNNSCQSKSAKDWHSLAKAFKEEEEAHGIHGVSEAHGFAMECKIARRSAEAVALYNSGHRVRSGNIDLFR